MDFTVRDWMILIGGLLILVVLLDGYRRMRNSPDKIKMSLAKVSKGSAVDVVSQRELPNGGARVIVRDAESDPNDILFTDPGSNGEDNRRQPPATDKNLAEGFSANSSDARHPGSANANAGQTIAGKPTDTEVVMLNVIAKSDAGFFGEDILQILLACDMRFGEMSFFHRHEQVTGKGEIQFSVANMVQPGVFDIDAMADFHTPGLSFFVNLPGPKNMMQAFDYMVETAQCVADNLDGELLDESRSVMTKQTLEHSRQKIRDLERRLLAVAR